MSKDSLGKYCETGKKESIGGKEVVIMPLPISRLKKIAGYLQDHVDAHLTEMLASQKENPNIMQMVVDVLTAMDVCEIVFHALTTVKNPETGQPFNGDVTKEWLEDYLDIPTIQRLVPVFIEVNELESLIKNYQRLPLLGQIVESLKATFGIALLTSLPANMVSQLERPESSPSLSSMDSSEASTGETPLQTNESVH